MKGKRNKVHERIVWHQALTTPQSVRIRKIHGVLGKKLLGEFERFEAEFLQELYIDEAIARYEKIAQEFANWRKEHWRSDISLQKKIVDRMIERRSCQGGDS